VTEQTEEQRDVPDPILPHLILNTVGEGQRTNEAQEGTNLPSVRRKQIRPLKAFSII
jgi:hypothetical protein